MLTREQLNILATFRKDIFSELTFRQIKEISGQKSNNVVQIALKEFQMQDLIRTKKTGNVASYSLNLDNNLAVAYLNVLNEWEIRLNKKIPMKILKDIQKRISKRTEFFILSVFGSYAENKAKADSDLDIAVIVDSEETKKDITPLLETAKRREVIPLDCHVFTREEFLEMMNSEQENIGKQIYKKSIVFYGFGEYCNMIRGRRHE